MLYYLFRFLEQFGIPGASIWGYISFRALLALMLGLIISMWFGERFIRYMRRRNIGETARDASIDPFGEKKVGVPSMGGIIIIVAILVPTLLLGRLRNIYTILMIVTTLWFGLLGFLDDYIKIFKKNKDGLAGKWKIIGQVIMGLVVGLTLYLSPDAVIRENVERGRVGDKVEIVHKSEAVKSTKTTIPFFKNNNLDYADIIGFVGDHKQAVGWMVFVLMVILVTTAVSNGANLNDGMDGMTAGNSAFICIALGILAYVSSHRIRLLPQHHVCAWFPRVSRLHLCHGGSTHRILVVQCLSSTSVYGRHGLAHHRRHHCRLCHHYSQGTLDSYPLWGLLYRKSECHHPNTSLQILQAQRQTCPCVQEHSHPRHLPPSRQPARSNFQVHLPQLASWCMA